MSEHVSNLVLDELAAGLRSDAPAHLESCAECRARYEKLTAGRAAVAASPRFEQTFTRVKASAEAAPPRRRSWLALLVPVAAVAAAVALAVVPREGPESERLKGAASLSVARSDPAAKGPFVPGERVALVLGAAGHHYAVVVGLDEAGAVSVLWPTSGTRSAAAPDRPGPVDPAFEVTAGSLRLFAFYSDEPLPLEAAAQAVADGWAAVRARGAGLAEVDPARLPGEAARARVSVEVAKSGAAP